MRYVTRQTLIQRIAERHDDQSWAEFESIYRGYIYTIIYNMNISESDADDLAQQVLLKIWKNMSVWSSAQGGRFHNWISTITKNSIIDFIRKRKRESLYLEESTLEGVATHCQEIQPDEFEKNVETTWRKHLTKLALNNIEPLFSGNAIRVFRMSLKGIPDDVIAAKLNLKKQSVYRLRSRVKVKLIEEVEHLRTELE